MDEYHVHEALDRTHCLMNIIEDQLLRHPYFLSSENQKKRARVEKAFQQLSRVYQAIGAKHLP